jgi:hypothetical protein
VYGTGIRVAPEGYGTANLSNNGEPIALVGPLGEALQAFTWDDIPPWPAGADGNGPSLEIIDPLGDATNPANWRSSAIPGGSPGRDGLAVPGDYNGNGVVDAADQNTWRASYGLAVPLGSGADGNGNATIDAGDYVVWRNNFDASLAASATMPTHPAASPIPASAAPPPASAMDEAQDQALVTLFAPTEPAGIAKRPFKPSQDADRSTRAASSERTDRMRQLLMQVALLNGRIHSNNDVPGSLEDEAAADSSVAQLDAHVWDELGNELTDLAALLATR